MNEDSCGDLVDLFYNAAFEPGLWVAAMERLSDRIGGSSVWLSQLNMLTGEGDGIIARIDPAMPGVYREYYALKNPLSNVADPDQYLHGWTPKILTDEDWMPKEELLRSEYYNDFLVPQDIHSTLMIRLSTDGYDVSAINVNRPRRSEQFGQSERETVEKIHPHLIRAFRLAQKITGVRELNEDLIATLDRSPNGIALLDPTGRIRHLNRAAEALIARADGLRVCGGRLSASASDPARRLAALIASAGSPDRAGARGGSMALPSRFGRLPLSITVAPALSDRVDIFDRGPSVIVCITDLEAGVSVPEQKLRDLFALTRAEARVMLALFEGFTLQEAAENLGVSFHTVRVHLGRIFEKTGVHRQTDLVRLTMRTVGALGA